MSEDAFIPKLVKTFQTFWFHIQTKVSGLKKPDLGEKSWSLVQIGYVIWFVFSAKTFFKTSGQNTGSYSCLSL